MGFFKRRRFISVRGRKSTVPDGLWIKCPGCKQAVYRAEVTANQEVCPTCKHHYRIGARKRIEKLVDDGTFEERHKDLATLDPLGFKVGDVTYLEKVQKAKKKLKLEDAIVTGYAKIEGTPTTLGVMDFSFRGGSMGSVVGEKFCRIADDAIREKLPFVIFSASGGARMEEGIYSLMQMAKTADAVRAMNEASIPYISVLTDPTSGGVYASFASLGDVTIAEPRAYIGFAGTRLILGATNTKKLPEGFQTAEYQYENGFIDHILERSEIRPFLGKLLRFLEAK